MVIGCCKLGTVFEATRGFEKGGGGEVVDQKSINEMHSDDVLIKISLTTW